MHQYTTDKLPPSFNNMFTLIRNTVERNSRDCFYNYVTNVPVRKGLANFPSVIFIPIWNSMSSYHQSTLSHKIFKSDYKKDILDKYSESEPCDNLNCEECGNS